MKAPTKPFKMRMRITGLNCLIADEFQSAASFTQPQFAFERARVRHQARHSEVNLNVLTMVWHLKRKPWPSPSTFTYTLVPFNEQVIVQQGSEGQNRRPQMYILESPWSHERSFLERKLTLITKMAYQTIALLIVFAIRTYIYDSLDKIVENTWPPVPNCRPLGQMKNIYKTHSEPSDPN